MQPFTLLEYHGEYLYNCPFQCHSGPACLHRCGRHDLSSTQPHSSRSSWRKIHRIFSHLGRRRSYSCGTPSPPSSPVVAQEDCSSRGDISQQENSSSAVNEVAASSAVASSAVASGAVQQDDEDPSIHEGSCPPDPAQSPRRSERLKVSVSASGGGAFDSWRSWYILHICIYLG